MDVRTANVHWAGNLGFFPMDPNLENFDPFHISMLNETCDFFKLERFIVVGQSTVTGIKQCMFLDFNMRDG